MGLDLWGARAPRQVTKAPWKNVRDWNKSAFAAGVPAKVFCGSLMDWAEDRDDLIEPRARMWEVIRESRHLIFQMLTKRPENIARFLPSDWGPSGYDNVWLGTTIEDNRVAHRAAPLISNPAPVHFVSYEPAIGPLDQLDLTCIEWVIYGGESGPKHRPEDKQWARDMHARCSESGVAFFHKQSSGWRTELGIELDGKIVREYPSHNYTP
jgi:protein gp37